ncbi:MAG: 50S ribosome-binding GTPase [Peptococcaceae bacterium]|nr:50S ribosome-binding GTPase [Peptococcaceae bacterium]
MLSDRLPTEGIRKKFNITKKSSGQKVVALAGNPNTGKSTIFNALTGLRQHTGNWPGKTVIQTRGTFSYGGSSYILVDLPGTYSLLASSADEQAARDFLCFAQPDATVAVADATCLERNLNLVLQVMEITSRVVVCVNLIDEARRKKISIDLEELSAQLGVPVVATAARSGLGIAELKERIHQVAFGKLTTNPRRLVYDPEIEEAVSCLEHSLKALIPPGVNSRWLSLRILEGDRTVLDAMREYSSKISYGREPAVETGHCPAGSRA